MLKLINLSQTILLLFLYSCGREEHQSQTQTNENFQNAETKINILTETYIQKWRGKYIFTESAEGLTKDISQSWEWTVTIDSSSRAKIEVDGFQTMIRIEADLKVNDQAVEFIFSKYMPDNMFELYKKGDKLFSFQINNKGEMVTNWDKMQPNVLKNRINGKVMFRKIPA